MVVQSKFITIETSCVDYVHPWTSSCIDASAALFLHCIIASLRIYVTAYVLTLLMRGKVPTKNDILYTILGIIQSTAFLSCCGFGYSLALCCLRRIIGNFNFLTVSFLPSFISSLVAILVERPSRRSLLSLYVTNVASETLFRMAVWRKWVKPVQFGEVAIFSISSAILLYFYRGLEKHNKKDSIYALLRFFVGPCEEGCFKEAQELDIKYCIPNQSYIRSVLNNLIPLKSNPSCKHQDSCLYYSLKSAFKLFGIGSGLQFCVKLLLQMNRIKRPSLIFQSIFQYDTLKLGAFFAGFGGIFRASSCIFRHIRNKDDQVHAIPAGLLAGLAFFFFRDNTAALYAMWKAMQIMYSIGVKNGYLPPFPGGSEFFYSFATAVLFHAAVLEPHNLRPSYWRFLTNISGNRINQMSRDCLDVFGLESSKSLQIAQERILQPL